MNTYLVRFLCAKIVSDSPSDFFEKVICLPKALPSGVGFEHPSFQFQVVPAPCYVNEVLSNTG